MRFRTTLAWPAALVLSIASSACDTGPLAGEPIEALEMPVPVRTVYATPRIERAMDVVESTDGDLFVVGYGDGGWLPNDGLYSDPLILRISDDGTLQQEVDLGQLGYGYVTRAKTVNGGLLFLARTSDDRNGSIRQNHLLRSDLGGIFEVWTDPSFGEPTFLFANSGTQLVLLQQEQRPDYTLVSYDSGGSVTWTVSGSAGDLGNFAGYTGGDLFFAHDLTDTSFETVCLSDTGAESWRRVFEYKSGPAARYGEQYAAGAGRIAVAGEARYDDGTRTVFVAAFDLDGDLLWDRDFITGEDLDATAVAVLPDGSVAFAWSRLDDHQFSFSSQLVLLNSKGAVGWRLDFESGYDTAIINRLIVTASGRLVALGEVGPPGDFVDSDVVVWQLDL